jgi:hypothetical protein
MSLSCYSETVLLNKKSSLRRSVFGFFLLVLITGTAPRAQAADEGAAAKIVLVAGRPSHGPGEHEHNAGVLLLERCLNEVPGVAAKAHLNGWPSDPAAFDGADAIVLYMDGGDGHPLVQGDHLQ